MPGLPVIGIFATCDPRIDQDSRTRSTNIVKMAANQISGTVITPDKTAVPVVYSEILVDGEKQADTVAAQFKQAGVNIIVCVPTLGLFHSLQCFHCCRIFPKKPHLILQLATAGQDPELYLLTLPMEHWPSLGGWPISMLEVGKILGSTQ